MKNYYELIKILGRFHTNKSNIVYKFISIYISLINASSEDTGSNLFMWNLPSILFSSYLKCFI